MSQHHIDVFFSVMPFLLQGFAETLKLSLVGVLWGSVLGALLGIIRGQQIAFFSPLIGAYIHILRGTPFLVQLYIAYFVLPNTGLAWLMWDSQTAAFASLGIYTSSYVTEIVSAAIRAIPRGQWEASFAVGFTRMQSLRHVILPQSVGLIMPSLGGVYVNLIKATSIVSVVGIAELTRQGEISILRFPADILYIYLLVALLYFAFCFPVLMTVDWLERRTKVGAKYGTAVLSGRLEAAE
ncbi:amino acid ABC transporter permease [Aquamicrobium sp. NLF2-7]|uniref:amino acid ABC transporter permease n=1 Tax=unclassified Aquamicrobium TaxID=2618194 RepID=UPI001EFC213B|nr:MULTISPECIES: amino acid ABC transporter permease [unclassified Aquamicrobium]MCG8272643.1 amino acid ABC transporter permease [Aquamicrobium sp. NLF2-7]MCK9552573.1 amino acid ABC transporter permease [Aquamicrobium sp.]